MRILAMTLVCFSLLMTELRFDWIEQLMGAYLATTNDRRPESGAIWEVGQQARSAHQTLEKIITDRIASQREAREATGFGDLAERLQPGQGVMLSAEHFRRLYLALPGEPAHEFVSPFRLLEIFSRQRCDRVYLKKISQDGGLSLFLLNTNNQVLETLDLPDHLLRLSRETEATRPDGRLEDDPTFQGRIYPADRFFAALAELPEEIRIAAVPYPERLLDIRGAIMRVGISDEVSGGYIRLGFEALEGGRPHVMLMQGREWAVWQLHSRLESGAPSPIRPGGGRS